MDKVRNILVLLLFLLVVQGCNGQENGNRRISFVWVGNDIIEKSDTIGTAITGVLYADNYECFVISIRDSDSDYENLIPKWSTVIFIFEDGVEKYKFRKRENGDYSRVLENSEEIFKKIVNAKEHIGVDVYLEPYGWKYIRFERKNLELDTTYY